MCCKCMAVNHIFATLLLLGIFLHENECNVIALPLNFEVI